MYSLLLVLPSAPRNVDVTFVNQSAVEIRWLPPAITGDKTQAFYEVDCRKPCNTDDGKKCVEESCRGDVTYIPYKEGLNVPQVIVTNLLSYVNYTFKVYAKNRASEVAKRKHGVEGNFTTITFRTAGSSEFVQSTEYTKYIQITFFSRAWLIRNLPSDVPYFVPNKLLNWIELNVVTILARCLNANIITLMSDSWPSSSKQRCLLAKYLKDNTTIPLYYYTLSVTRSS